MSRKLKWWASQEFRLLDALLERSPLAILACDASYIIRYANGAAVQQIRVLQPSEGDALIGRDLRSLPFDVSAELETLDSVLGETRKRSVDVGTQTVALHMYSLQPQAHACRFALAFELCASQAERAPSRTLNGLVVTAVTRTRNLSALSTNIEALAAQLQADLRHVTQLVKAVAHSASDIAVSVGCCLEELHKTRASVQYARGTVQALSTSTTSALRLLEIISGITQQTRLLALNATIEAAAPGNSIAGSGFGLITREVKELAKETNAATEHIALHLQSIRQDAEHVVDAVTDIATCVESMDKHGSLMGGASQEQARAGDLALRTAHDVQSKLGHLQATLARLSATVQDAQHNAAAIDGALTDAAGGGRSAVLEDTG